MSFFRWRFWRWVFLALWLAYGGTLIWRAWDRALQRDPQIRFDAFLWERAVELGPAILGAVGVIGALGLWAIMDGKLHRRADPSNGSAGLLDAARAYPVHLSVCVGLLALTTWAMFNAPTVAAVGIALAGMSCISLARRLGLEPPDDPAAPHNRGKT